MRKGTLAAALILGLVALAGLWWTGCSGRGNGIDAGAASDNAAGQDTSEGEENSPRSEEVELVAGEQSSKALAVSGENPPKNKTRSKGPDGVIDVLTFPKDLKVSEGESFTRWMKERGWVSVFGGPEYFYVRDGALHLVSKPGPIYRNRYYLMVFNRQKLIDGMENKVLLRLAGGKDFRIDAKKFPFVRFKMTPIELPGKDADLRDTDKNDSAFYLLVAFDTKRHPLQGRMMPECVAYVWANRKWDKTVVKDTEYPHLLRYIPIGHGSDGLGKPRVVTRNVRADYRTAYPEKEKAPVPDVIQVGIMVDSNTVGGTAESALHWIRFRNQKAKSSPQNE